MTWPFLFILKTPGFTSFVSRFGYAGIFLWFISFDQLTPIPEEVSLLTIGYLAAHKIFNPVLAGIFCLAGFVVVDTAYYFLSRKGSSFIKKKSKRSSAFIRSYKDKLKNNTPKAIMALCFIPRMRMFAPILAGSMRISLKRFLLFDSIALMAFTTVYLSLGFIFHNSLAVVIQKTKGLQHIIFFAAVVVLAIIIIVLNRRKNRNEKEDEES